MLIRCVDSRHFPGFLGYTGVWVGGVVCLCGVYTWVLWCVYGGFAGVWEGSRVADAGDDVDVAGCGCCEGAGWGGVPFSGLS